jgi:hypothetical protein
MMVYKSGEQLKGTTTLEGNRAYMSDPDVGFGRPAQPAQWLSRHRALTKRIFVPPYAEKQPSPICTASTSWQS